MSRLSTWAFVLTAFAAIQFATTADAGLKPVTVVDLIDRSEIITTGTVTSVFDGYDDNGIPFTEVTLDVDQTVKGVAYGEYTFRQFGLMEPRQREDGSWDLKVTPQEWPTFVESQTVLLFLYKAAIHTGFRSPVGLDQGAFQIVDGRIANEFANMGLFRHVYADPGLLTAEEESLFTSRGPLPADTFIEFIRRAVESDWVDEGRLNHVEP